MPFFLALMVGSALGLAADSVRQRGHPAGVVALVISLLGAIVAAFLLAGDDFVIVTLLLVFSFITGYLGIGRKYLERKRSE